MVTCKFSLHLFLFTALVWTAILLLMKFKRKSSKIIAFFIFSIFITLASLIASSSCLHDNKYSQHHQIAREIQKLTFNNRELLKKSPTNPDLRKPINITKEKISGQMAKNEIKAGANKEGYTKTASKKLIETKKASALEAKQLIEAVVDNNSHKDNVAKDMATKQANEKSATKEHVSLEWKKDLLNSDLTIVKLKVYQSIASQYTPDREQQAKKLQYLKTGAASAWVRRKHEAPFTPKAAEAYFGRYLPWWEMEEMKNYPKIWYLGLGFAKAPFSKNLTNNFGFSASIEEKESSTKRFYGLTVGDHIAFRYKILEILGRGTFGYVASVFDYQFNRKVAIKMYRSQPSKVGIMEQDIKEVNMLLKITTETKHKELFPLVHEYFVFRNHLCVVEELLGVDLSEATHKEPVKDINKLRGFARDIFSGVAELHRMNIAHMDLKTLNLAFAAPGKSNLKVMDFGHSCIPGNDYFECAKAADVQTPGYECPEVIFELDYGTSCDLFTVGVILLRLATGRQQFSGENSRDSFALMMEIIGLPPPHLVEESELNKFFMEAVCYTKKNGFKRIPYRKPLRTVVAKDLDEDLVDLISKLLRYEPSERIRAADALNHPFFNP